MKIKQLTLLQVRDILCAINANNTQFKVKFPHVHPSYRKNWFCVDIYNAIAELGDNTIAQHVKARYNLFTSSGKFKSNKLGTIASMLIDRLKGF